MQRMLAAGYAGSDIPLGRDCGEFEDIPQGRFHASEPASHPQYGTQATSRVDCCRRILPLAPSRRGHTRNDAIPLTGITRPRRWSRLKGGVAYGLMFLGGPRETQEPLPASTRGRACKIALSSCCVPLGSLRVVTGWECQAVSTSPHVRLGMTSISCNIKRSRLA